MVGRSRPRLKLVHLISDDPPSGVIFTSPTINQCQLGTKESLQTNVAILRGNDQARPVLVGSFSPHGIAPVNITKQPLRIEAVPIGHNQTLKLGEGALL